MGNHTAPFDAGCDNRLVHVPTGYINQTLLANTVAQATQKLGKDVVRVRHSGHQWRAFPVLSNCTRGRGQWESDACRCQRSDRSDIL
jgi:hypothetical protein